MNDLPTTFDVSDRRKADSGSLGAMPGSIPDMAAKAVGASADPEVTTMLDAAAQVASLADGSARMAEVAQPSLGLASKAMGTFESARAAASAVLAGNRVEPSYLAEHPLAGRSIGDFVTPLTAFVPSTPTVDGPEDSAAQGQFAQDRRLLRFYAPLSGPKKLFLNELTGGGSLSEPYRYRLRLISLDAGVDLKEMLGKKVTAAIQLADRSEHALNGYVSRFAYSHTDGGVAHYDADLVPWLWYLGHRVNSRMYQDLSVIEIIEKVFSEGYGALAKYELRISGQYKPESYVVQYDETDLGFVSRLLEQSGLFYYFEHEAADHTLIISDDSCNGGYCPPQEHHAEVRFNAGQSTPHEDYVTHLAAERNFQPSRIALNTFDFKTPSSSLYVELPTVADQGAVPKLEVYHGNPAFAYRSASDGEADARLRMEAIECRAKVFRGTSECRGLVAGHSFKLAGHHWFDEGQEGDNDFLVLSVDIEAKNNFNESDGEDIYRNHFTCIRRKIPFRPMRQHAKPVMKGPQSATVVGPPGAEIHTDKFGRIKVQFPWDRDGRHDERSSCWIRVSQPWAGKGWGTVAIPRIGQEVVIDFLEGDPDRPLCIGRLFNTEQPAPYGLPEGAHQMGFRSRSTPGGGGHCEMVIHDQAGQEMINIHSQKDMATTVQNNQTTVVNGPERTVSVVNGRYVTTVKQEIQVESETQHVFIKANTNITLALSDDHQVVLDKESGTIALVVGQSKIIMSKDGVISIEGKQIINKGPDGIFLN